VAHDTRSPRSNPVTCADAAILETAVSGNAERARHLLADEHGYLATAGELTDSLLTWLAEVEHS